MERHQHELVDEYKMLDKKQEELEDEFKMLDCIDGDACDEDTCKDLCVDRSPGDGDSTKSDPIKKNQSTQTNMKNNKKQV